MSFDLNAFGAIQAKASALPPRRKPPKHRHATPSGPWPFLDLDDDVDPAQLTSPPPQPKFYEDEETENGHGSVLDSRPYWSHYPQSQFANWTQWQQNKSGIARLVNRRLPMPENCRIFKLDIQSDGIFRANNIRSEGGDYVVRSGRPPSEARIKVFFVDNLSGPVLQMLGTKYRIEPFFFSSSLNSIPSRYQEQVRRGKGDHITLTLSFIRTLPSPSTAPPTPTTSYADSAINEDTLHMLQSSILMQAPIIDVEAPLVLTSDPNKLLVLDMISLHVIRRNTIISYHLPSTPPFNTTSASALHKRLLAAGRSVYWSHIFQSTVPSGDPTFVTLSLLWYPLYAWDEVLDTLLVEVASLEAHTLSALPSDRQDEDAHDQTHVLTHQLHVIRAHLLHYESLLDDFRKTVEFLLKTVNPGLTGPSDSESYERLLNKECTNLLNEIDRLEMTRAMLDNRLGNVMELAFSSVNIEDSRRMKNLAEVSVRDSAVMKQISYLTMIFLPASFVAAIFGMNVMEINPGSYGTVLHYLAAAIPLTVLTVWVMMMQYHATKQREPLPVARPAPSSLREEDMGK
ncbi:hypothetical protein DFH05DRAFT_1537615 [Lentinula detonsa]|uniref:Uncharacterized protein n=1 Tax=Lentinula detonsa TaxID=2804962 RepID=A0A9W8TU82_9AGAR|nr:hypothetical protein DFH05DRAFT_1537615 [Lentinula detonsa]